MLANSISSKQLRRARMLALSVPVCYAVFGIVWILVSDLALEALHLPSHVNTRIAMVKGWIFVAGSTLLIAVVMRSAWSILESAYAELKAELAQRRIAQEKAVRLAEELELRVLERTKHLEDALSDLAMFSDSVSHDLRSPLRVVAGYAQALEESHASSLGSEGLQYVSRLRHSVGRMDRMISGLLELSRHGRSGLRVETFPALQHQALVDEVWAEVETVCKGRAFRFEREALRDVRCDPALIEHVWRNLLSNAAKYTRGREMAVIRVGFQDGWFSVIDNGVGFDSTQASRLFRPFQRLHRTEEFEGDGIGLALVGRIIERHGGKIEAKSQLGEGCEFRFFLP